jgi:antitoxin CptB
MLDPARLNRLRWRARRGLLENDIVMARFFEQHAETLSDEQISGLDLLLEYSDNDLMDFILARDTAKTHELNPASLAVLSQLQAA